MKRRYLWTGTLLLLIFAALPAGAAEHPLAVGREMPPITLEVPAEPALRQYLGLPATGTFTLSDVRADVLVVEIFSMYCPHCQREAPTVNAFYKKIEETPALKGRVKLIGIGAGNTAFEVEFFKSTYAVPFPLFPDGEFVIHKATGEVRTPYFIGLRIKPPSATIFYSELGGPKDAREFLENLIKRAGLD